MKTFIALIWLAAISCFAASPSFQQVTNTLVPAVLTLTNAYGTVILSGSISNTAGTHYINVQANGVGVDKASPGETLDVTGNIQASIYLKAGTAVRAYVWPSPSIVSCTIQTENGTHGLGVVDIAINTNTVFDGAVVFMPAQNPGPVWVTNGLSAFWNSNGVATYIRHSVVGAITYTDTKIQEHASP